MSWYCLGLLRLLGQACMMSWTWKSWSWTSSTRRGGPGGQQKKSWDVTRLLLHGDGLEENDLEHDWERRRRKGRMILSL
jgi:hypothetical protein